MRNLQLIPLSLLALVACSANTATESTAATGSALNLEDTSFSSPSSYANGTAPSIALGGTWSNPWYAEVHQGGPCPGEPGQFQLWAGAGQLNASGSLVALGSASLTETPWEFTCGATPSIAEYDIMNPWSGAPTWLELHQGGSGSLWLRQGAFQAAVPGISWSSNVTELSGVGYNPKIAAFGGYAIEVDQLEPEPANPSATWYTSMQVRMSGPTTSASTALPAFSAPSVYGQGSQPTVAMGLGTVVEMHQGQNGQLWYNVAMTDNGVWSTMDTAEPFAPSGFTTGYAPSIAVMQAGFFPPYVIEVHQTTPTGGPLMYTVGTVMGEGSIAWGTTTQYSATGSLPVAAMDSLAEGEGMEVHQNGSGGLVAESLSMCGGAGQSSCLNSSTNYFTGTAFSCTVADPYDCGCQPNLLYVSSTNSCACGINGAGPCAGVTTNSGCNSGTLLVGSTCLTCGSAAGQYLCGGWVCSGGATLVGQTCECPTNTGYAGSGSTATCAACPANEVSPGGTSTCSACPSGEVDASGTCKTCGANGDPACSTSTNGGCNSGTVNSIGTCKTCGANGDPACSTSTNSGCNSGTVLVTVGGLDKCETCGTAAGDYLCAGESCAAATVSTGTIYDSATQKCDACGQVGQKPCASSVGPNKNGCLDFQMVSTNGVCECESGTKISGAGCCATCYEYLGGASCEYVVSSSCPGTSPPPPTEDPAEDPSEDPEDQTAPHKSLSPHLPRVVTKAIEHLVSH